VGLLWGALDACLVPNVIPEVAVGGCLGLELGAALGTGRGIAEPISSAAPWVALEASARVEWWLLAELALVLSIGGAVPLLRPVFSIEGLGRLYRPEPVDGTLTLGLEIHLS
jgi:hypothetical protein